MYERRRILEKFEEQKSFVNEKVESGINANRKGAVRITLKNEAGEAIPNYTVRMVQKTHEFKYGANLFMLDELETEEKNEKYKDVMSSFGNIATLPFYWNATEPRMGHTRYNADSEKLYRRPSIDLCMDFCQKHGIEPREHGLAYPAFFPVWLVGKSDFEVKSAMERRYSEIAERYASRIPTIEVTNELEWRNWQIPFYESEELVEYSFKLAEKYFSANQLVINEHTVLCWADRGIPSDKYFSYIDANIRRGARIDAIGMQFHMFKKQDREYEDTRPYYDPIELYRHMDLYAKFGKPLQVTEITIPAYSNSSEDEELQAEVIKNLYTIWFSHPAVEQIIYWNMVDGYAHLWDPDPEKIRRSLGNMSLGENVYYGGLFRFDMTPKPAYYVIKELFEKKWHTETQGVTSENGNATLMGFYGKYELEIVSGGKTLKTEIDLQKGKINKFEFII